MQVSINKVRITDLQSDFNNQLVDLSISDGVITKIQPVKKNAAKAIPSIVIDGIEVWKYSGNAQSEILLSAGWVDVFADYCEPGYEQKETITTGLAAAAAGGFTDVFLVPNTQPVINSKSAVQYILGKATGDAVNLHPLGCATQNAEGKEIAEMLDMRNAGALAFSDGWKPIQQANLLLKTLEYVKAFDGTIIQMPVDAALSSGGLMHEGIVSTTLGMPGIPSLAESLIVFRDIELAKYTGSKLHITGVSTAEAVDMIRKAKAEGVAVSCSVTPYHLALTDETLKTYDSAFKVTPPLRTEADRQALIAAIADGTIDCIASHHRPHEWDAKVKEFEYAANGMALQEISFQVIWEAVHNMIGIEQLISLFTTNPRKVFGLGKVAITVGAPASFTIFSTEDKHTLTAQSKKSAGMNNPFLGKNLHGAVIGIYNNMQLSINQ